MLARFAGVNGQGWRGFLYLRWLVGCRHVYSVFLLIGYLGL